MTMPLDSQAYPNSPAAPSSAPAGYVTPGTVASPNGAPLTPEQIAAQRGNFIELILREVVRALTGVFMPVSAAFDQLVNWVQNILPDWITQPINDLIELLISVLDLIPVIGPPAGDALEYLASVFGFLRDNTATAQTTGDSAQTGANVANIEIAIIKAGLDADAAGGAALSDKFDGVAAGSLDPALWSQTYLGPGVGYLGLDGSGNAQWFTSGGAPLGSLNCFLTPLDTDNESVAVLLGSVPDATNATWPEIHLLLRMDGAGNAVAARIFNGAVQIGYYVSNTFTSLGSPVVVGMSGQQSYQFIARTVGATHTFAILQNNIEVASLTSPTSGPTLYGASYRQPGWLDYAGTFSNFFLFFQAAPPVVRVFSAGDIL